MEFFGYSISPTRHGTTRTARKPRLLEYRSSTWFIVLTVCVAVFSDLFLYGIIVPILPFALEERVGIDAVHVQEYITIFLAVYAAFLLAFSPISGWIADRTETRRLPLLVSLLLLAGATLLLMLGRSVSLLVIGRGLQGLSAAAVWSIGLALLVDSVGPDKVGEAMGYVSLSMSLAIFTAPLLGGVVFAKSNYYAVFAMAFGTIAIDIILRLLVIEKKVASKWSDHEQRNKESSLATNARVDIVSTAETSTRKDIEPVTSASSQILRKGDKLSAQNSQTPCCTLSTTKKKLSDESATEDPTNHYIQKRKTWKTSPLAILLASGRLLAALGGCLVAATIMSAFDTTLPLRVATIFKWDSIGTGLIFLSLVIPSLLNPLLGKVADRYGSRLLTTTGLLLNVPLLICLRFVNDDTIRQKVLLCSLLALIGFSLSCALIPLLAEITWSVDSKIQQQPHRFANKGAYAQGYGLMNAAYAAGTLIGPLWSGFISDRAGWATMTWSLSLFSGLSAIPIFLYLGGWIGDNGLKNVHKQSTRTDQVSVA